MEHIILIDDDKNTNLYHEIIIQQAFANIRVKSFTEAEIALTFLANSSATISLIFSDLRMPYMSGWEFVKNYQILYEQNTQTAPVIMLSDSIDRTDTDMAKQFNCVIDLQNKPLDINKIPQQLLITDGLRP